MWIKEIVNNLMEKHSSINPFALAEKLKVHVFECELHSDIRGYYKYDRRNKYIILNSNLKDDEKLLVCAHELGHAILHPRANTKFMKQNTLLSVSRIEREANRFAAELLIPDSLMNDDYEQLTIFDIASLHNVPEELVRLKFKGLFL